MPETTETKKSQVDTDNETDDEMPSIFEDVEYKAGDVFSPHSQESKLPVCPDKLDQAVKAILLEYPEEETRFEAVGDAFGNNKPLFGFDGEGLIILGYLALHEVNRLRDCLAYDMEPLRMSVGEESVGEEQAFTGLIKPVIENYSPVVLGYIFTRPPHEIILFLRDFYREGRTRYAMAFGV